MSPEPQNTHIKTGKNSRTIIIILLLVVGAITVFTSASFLLVRQQALKAVEKARKKLNVKNFIELELILSHPINQPLMEGLKVLSTARNAYDIVQKDGIIYIATSGGLLKISGDGSISGPFNSDAGILSPDLTSLDDMGESGLLMGSSDGSLMLLKDGIANIYRFPPPKPTGISSILTGPGGLALVGTFSDGVLAFDAGRISTGIMELKGADFKDVTALESCDAFPLAIGTARKGIYLLQMRAFNKFTREDGLVADEITSLACSVDNHLLIGTPQGLMLLSSSGTIKELLRDTFVSAIAIRGETIYAGTVGDGLIKIHEGTGKVLDKTLQGKRINRLKNIGGKIYALTSDGVYIVEEGRVEPLYTSNNDELPSNHITAIKADAAGNIWVGTFEKGLRIMSKGGQAKLPEGSEQPRAVNNIVNIKGRTYVATTWGVYIYDGEMLAQKLGKDQGLISEQVSAVGTSSDDSPVFATSAGVSLHHSGTLKSLYGFHGLANNHTYCTKTAGNKIYIGTLGGLSVIEDAKVVKNYSAAGDGLPANWITALVADDTRLYIGTYGKGLAYLDQAGVVKTFENEPGDYEANINAMIINEGVLYSGSLDRGVMLYNLKEGKFAGSFISGLPSPNVTAIEIVGTSFYIGTDHGIAVVDKGLLTH